MLCEGIWDAIGIPVYPKRDQDYLQATQVYILCARGIVMLEKVWAHSLQ